MKLFVDLVGLSRTHWKPIHLRIIWMRDDLNHVKIDPLFHGTSFREDK